MSQPSANGDWSSRIVHFDATQVRREKMARKASHPAPATPAPAPAAPAPVTPAARVPAPVERPAPPAAAPAPPPAAPAPSAVTRKANGPKPEEMETFLINFVVEQTGYPPEIVEMDADLEADLGIDSIKKAQLFGELREYFDLQPVEGMTLDDFPTLRHVLNFLRTGSPKADQVAAPAAALAPVPAPPPPPASAPAPVASVPAPAPTTAVTRKANAPKPEEMESFLINFVVEQTGYPPEIVEMDADLEADLGIDSIKKAQLFGELREYFDLQPVEGMTLDDFPTLRHVLNFLRTGSPKGEGAAPAAAAPAPVQTKIETVAVTPAPAPMPAPVVAAVAAAPAPSTAVTRKANAPSPDQLEPFLVNFVVEQTGYPPEIVELDADLEADLGIDSIKKAQLFGELREYFDIQPVEGMTLDDFPTLRHVMQFLQGTHPKFATLAAAPVAPKPAAAPAPAPTPAPAPRAAPAPSPAPAPRTSVAPSPPRAAHASGNGNGNGASAGVTTIALRPSAKPSGNGESHGDDWMKDASILDAIRRILIERGIADPTRANLTSSTRLMDDVGLDSVGMLDLINAVEQEFNIHISLDDLELEGLNSSAAFARLIQRKLTEVEA